MALKKRFRDFLPDNLSALRTLNIQQVLKSLAGERPIFHSEADFQHSLAWKMREIYPTLHPRLEYPLNSPGDSKRKACDIVLLQNGKVKVAIELKYFTKKFEHEINGEIFYLKEQSAHDIRCYDTFKDIKRMEDFLKANPTATAIVIVVTNDPIYWEGPRSDSVKYAQFSLEEDRFMKGTLGWLGKSPSEERSDSINLRGEYTLNWQKYNQIAKDSGVFKYLYVSIG